MTGSSKKGNNRTSLNLQYKALNILGEILAYCFLFFCLFVFFRGFFSGTNGCKG